MYSYPLKLEFPFISLGRQVDVKNGDGGFIMRVTDPFISFKDAMTVVNGKGTAAYQINGDTSFRFLFQFASMSTDWTIQTADGKPVAFVRNYFARMEEFQGIGVQKPSSINPDGTPSIGGIAGQFAANMINQTVSRNVPGRLVYQIRDKEEGGTTLGWIVPSRGTGWFDFLPYSTRIKILNLPFAARAYAPSYEFKLGNLSGPTILKLQKQRDLFIDRYALQKISELSETDERWVVPSLTLVTMFERQRVKEMADW